MKKNIVFLIIYIFLIYGCSTSQDYGKVSTITGMEVNTNNIKNQEEDSVNNSQNSTNDIENLENTFKKLNYIKMVDLASTIDEEEQFIKGLGISIYRLGLIKYRLYKNISGDEKIIINLQGDREDLDYEIYFNGNGVIFVKKIYSTYNIPKREKNSYIENSDISLCKISENNCSNDIIFLIKYLKDKDLLSY